MNRRDTLVAGLLSASLVAFLAPLTRIGVDFHHDGIMLKPALDVLSGQVLFRDTFMQYGALTCYLQVLALWIYPTLLSIKLMTVAAYGVTLFFLYASWRLILPRSLAILSCCLFILFIPGYEKDWFDHYLIFNPWSSVFAMMFQSMALYALFRIIRDEQSEQWGLVLGATCASVFWCRQPVGLIMIGCVTVTWLALHWTNWAPVNYAKRSVLVRISAGFVSVNAVMLGGILLTGGRSAWWYQNYIWPKKWAEDMYEGWSYFFTKFLHPEAGIGLLVLLLAIALPALMKKFRPTLPAGFVVSYYFFLVGLMIWQHERMLQVFALREGGWTFFLPLVVLLQAIISITRAFATRTPVKTTEYYLIATLSALSVGSVLQYYPVPDSWHVAWSLAPAFGLCVFGLWRWSGWRASVLVAVLFAAFLPSLWAKIRLVKQALVQPTETLVSPAVLRGMKVPASQARFIGQIMDTLGQISRFQPNMPGVLIGNDAMFLCLTTNHTNPSAYFVTWAKLADNEENQKRWNYILGVRPLMFLHKTNRQSVDDFYRRAQYVPLLSVPDEALEIAVPLELAKKMGRPAYGEVVEGGPVKAP